MSDPAQDQADLAAAQAAADAAQASLVAAQAKLDSDLAAEAAAAAQTPAPAEIQMTPGDKFLLSLHQRVAIAEQDRIEAWQNGDAAGQARHQAKIDLVNEIIADLHAAQVP